MSQLFLFNEEKETEEELDTDCKQCTICGEKKNRDKFPKHSNHKDNLDSRCKDCVKKEAKIRKQIKETAPPVPEDGKCQCCGRVVEDLQYNKSWHLDHCHKTLEFRGWTCNHCNVGIGLLGDDTDGLIKALNYLYEAKRRGA